MWTASIYSRSKASVLQYHGPDLLTPRRLFIQRASALRFDQLRAILMQLEGLMAVAEILRLEGDWRLGRRVLMPDLVRLEGVQ